MNIQKFSHEVRTPLNGILGFCNLLGNTSLNERQLELLERIQSCSISVLSLINDHLDLAKLENGTLQLKQSPFDVRSLKEQVHSAVMLYVNQKQQTLIWDIQPSCTIVFGDVHKLTQIMVNLIVNASKFAPVETSILVTLRQDTQLFHCTVEDFGCGIAEDLKLFTKYSSTNGIGLGLFISYELIQLMKGTISGQNKVNTNGAVFKFSIPTCNDLHMPSSTIQQLRQIKCVLVSEKLDTRMNIEDILHKFNVQVKTCSSYIEYTRALTRTRYDIAIADIHMLQTNKLLNHIQHIIVGRSNTLNSELKRKCSFVYVPINETLLIQTISQLVWGHTHTITSECKHTLKQKEKHVKHVLIADDIQYNCDILQEIMARHFKVTIQCTSSIKSTIATLSDPAKFDLIILDLKFPDGSGADVVDYLATQRVTNMPKIIIMTACIEARNTMKCSDQIYAFIEKPMHIPTVINVIAQALKRS